MKNSASKLVPALLCLFILYPKAAAADPAVPRETPSISELGALGAADLAGMADMAAPGLPDAVKPRPLSPVVITLPGLKFSKVGWGPINVYNLYDIFTAVFSRRDPVEQAALEAEFSDADRAGIISGAPLLDEEPLTGKYFEIKLRALPEFAANPVTVVPFEWSMDPVDSDKTVPALVAGLTQVCDDYRNTGRPVYVVAHSWGTVLMHDALHRLAETRPDVKIDKFITTGSPLVPGRLFLKIGMSMQRFREGLLKEVSKPANVGYWENAWSSRDPFSSAIPAADENEQVDASLGDLEAEINDIILRNDALKPQAKKDLSALRHTVNWHRSYYQDFRAEFKSLGKTIHLRLFRPGVASQAMNVRLVP